MVKLVAVLGDVRQQRGQRHRRIVRLRPGAGGAGSHQNGAGQNRAGFEQHFIGRQLGDVSDSRQHGIERALLNHKSAVAAFAVDQIGIPLAEMIIRPAVDRMIEIVRPRIDRQFIERIEFEPRRFKQIRRRFAAESPVSARSTFDTARSRSRRRRCTAESVALARADTVRGDDFPAPARAVADKIVHAPQGLVDDSFRFVPRPPGGDQRFGHSTDEKRPPQIGIALVEQQIAVMLAVGRQKPVEQQLQNPLGLFGIVKRRIVLSQFDQFLCQ